jgi:predicted RNA-binding Zn-ribbon protein involved in translation (DUF1610 family)
VTDNRIVKLQLIGAPATGPVISAPPVLDAGAPDGTEHGCGNCGAVLLKAAEGQVRNLQIRCADCGSYNTTGT